MLQNFLPKNWEHHLILLPKQLTLVARQKLREKFMQAEVGVTGANFIISDIGAIAVTENEGNARLSCAFPKTHIAIVGIEKVIPSITDLGIVLAAAFNLWYWSKSNCLQHHC